MTTFNTLLAQHIGAAFARQVAFADLLGTRNWSVDISRGQCQFGDDLTFPIQLLGTEADEDRTWLWAWANAASELPPRLLTSCHRLQELGRREGIAEFTERSFSQEVVDGHTLALCAAGLDGQSCYYRGPYEGGAVFFLVADLPAAITQPVVSARALFVITQVIGQYPVNHRLMADAFLASQGYMVETTLQGITAVRGNETMTMACDTVGRITKITGNCAPPPAPKRWWRFWQA